MPEGPYHSSVKEIIHEILIKSKKYKRVFKEQKIPLAHPRRSMLTHMYLPEIYVETKYGKKYIFEILDSQGKDPNLIIADIIQAYLVENVSKVFFITKNKKEEELTKRLSVIIAERLGYHGYDKRELPEVMVYSIEEKDWGSGLPKKLKFIAKKDSWG